MSLLPRTEDTWALHSVEVTSNAGVVSSLYIRSLLKENIKVRKDTARESLLLCAQPLLRGLREGK